MTLTYCNCTVSPRGQKPLFEYVKHPQIRTIPCVRFTGSSFEKNGPLLSKEKYECNSDSHNCNSYNKACKHKSYCIIQSNHTFDSIYLRGSSTVRKLCINNISIYFYILPTLRCQLKCFCALYTSVFMIKTSHARLMGPLSSERKDSTYQFHFRVEKIYDICIFNLVNPFDII